MTSKINLDEIDRRLGLKNSTLIKRPRAGELLPVSVFAETELGRLSALRVDIDGKTELRLQLRQGERGKTGLTGERGIQGPVGNPGWQGDKGDRGNTGDTGKMGEIGPKGEIGRPGRDGAGVNEYAELRLEVSRQRDITTTFTDTLAEHGSKLLLMNDSLFRLRREFEDAVIRGVQQTFIAAGGGSLTIKDEGVGTATATTLNFVGANISASVLAGVATITVSAPTDLSAAPFITFGASGLLSAERSIDSSDAFTFATGESVKWKWNSVGTENFLVENSGSGGAIVLKVIGDTANLSLYDIDDTVAQTSLGLQILGFGAGGAAAADAILSRSAANTFLFASGDLVRFGGGVRLDASQTLRFRNPADTFQSTFVAGAQVADLTYTLPIAAPAIGNKVLLSSVAGLLYWGNPAGSFEVSDDAFVIAMSVAH